MRAALLYLAACSSMPAVNGDTLGEPGTAKLSVSPDAAQVAVGGTPFTVTNTGDGPSGAIGAVITGDGAATYAVDHTTCSELQPGATCQITVRFLAQAAANATLGITENDAPKASATLTPGDTNASPHITVTPQMSTLIDTSCGHGFGTSKTIAVDVTNHTNAPLTQIAAGSNVLTAHGCTGTLADGATCTLTVGLVSTKAPSPLTGTSLVVVGNANGINYSGSAALHTQVDACLIDVEPAPFEILGRVGQPTEVQLTITNASSAGVLLGPGTLAPLASPSALISAASINCQTQLAPGAQCNYKVAYAPLAVDQIYAGSFQITAAPTGTGAAMQTSLTQVAAAVSTDSLAFDQILYDWGPVQVDNTMIDATEDSITLFATQATGPIQIMVPPPWKTDGNNPCTQGLPAPVMTSASSCTFKVSIDPSVATPGLKQAAITAVGQQHGSASAVMSALIQ